MSLHRRLVAVLAIVSSYIQYGIALLNNCYAPSGAQDFAQFACQPQASSSSCCSPGDVCYSNGLCFPGPTKTGPFFTTFFVDACTDPSFTAPNCIPNCLRITGNGVQTCLDLGPNHFCCYGMSGCNCSDPTAVFTLKAGTAIATIDLSATFTQSSASTSTSSSSTTTASSSTTPLSSASTSPTAAANSANGVVIGVGVGVGTVAVGALAGLAYFLWRHQKMCANTADLSAKGPPPATFPQGYSPHQGYPAMSTNELPTDQYYQFVAELPGVGIRRGFV